MPGKCRPSLRKKTLDNVMCSNLSQTDKDCIKAVFERYVEVVRCKNCEYHILDDDVDCLCTYFGKYTRYEDFCPYGERRSDETD